MTNSRADMKEVPTSASETGILSREWASHGDLQVLNPNAAHSATTGVDGGMRGHNGGVWEWTSTKFDEHLGFVASELYPGYSADFFDGCHHVVVSTWDYLLQVSY